MHARVLLFAALRERIGSAEVEVDLPERATVADLRAALVGKFPAVGPLVAVSRFAVDAEYADEATAIPPGADLAAIPPVSGGCSP